MLKALSTGLELFVVNIVAQRLTTNRGCPSSISYFVMALRESSAREARASTSEPRHLHDARRGVLIRMLCNGAVSQHMLDNLSLLVHEQRAGRAHDVAVGGGRDAPELAVHPLAEPAAQEDVIVRGVWRVRRVRRAAPVLPARSGAPGDDPVAPRRLRVLQGQAQGG